MNSVQLVGRLTNEPDLTYVGDGNAKASFTLAVNRKFTNAQGEREADFIRCVVWRKAAETFCNYVGKGQQVAVNGRIQTGSYEKDGQRVYTTDVIVEDFTFLSNKEGGQQNNQNQPQQNNDPFGNKGKIDISDSDLPF